MNQMKLQHIPRSSRNDLDAFELWTKYAQQQQQQSSRNI